MTVVLLAPQPNQSFWHVPPVGNSYHSDVNRRLIPLSDADTHALIQLGCEVEETRERLPWRLTPDTTQTPPESDEEPPLEEGA